MAAMMEVKAQTRARIASKVLDAINKVGQDNIISIIMDEGGKFANGSKFASMRAYVYYKN